MYKYSEMIHLSFTKSQRKKAVHDLPLLAASGNGCNHEQCRPDDNDEKRKDDEIDRR